MIRKEMFLSLTTLEKLVEAPVETPVYKACKDKA
jgi:hypothetical protein